MILFFFFYVDTLCKAPSLLAQSMCPSLIPEAQRIEKVYAKAFKLLGSCHRAYNTNTMDITDSSELGKTHIQ